MGSLSREFVVRSLQELDRASEELQKYSSVQLHDLETDLSLRWTVERGLLVGLSLVFQIGEHILTRHFHTTPETYEGSLRELYNRGVLPQQVYRALKGAGGFRNILVHEYTTIDLREVAKAVRSAPSVFCDFGRAVLRWMEKI